MRHALSSLLILILATTGCGDDGANADGGVDSSVTIDAVLKSIVAVRLRQELGGAMWANPSVYPQLPIQVNVWGTAAAVSVELDGVRTVAEDLDQDNIWTATVDITGLALGVPYTVIARGTGVYGKLETHEATLTLGTSGIQLTRFADVGAAATPRVHNVNRELWVTWADRRDTERELWLHRLDGAGVPLAGYETPVCIVCDADETLYGRVAAGDASLGVLYQKAGGPYVNYFKMVDGDGNNIIAPIPLDPAGWNGSFGGDVIFDGEHFIVVWRINDGAGGGEVRWLRVHGATGETIGPITVASSGAGNPIGGFEPFSFVKVSAFVGTSYVSFVRERYDSTLGLSLPRAQVAVVDRNGNILNTDYAEPETAWSFNYESRVFPVADGALLLWSAQDLTAADPIPTTFRGALIDRDGVLDPKRGNGAVVVTAPEHRVEPFFVAHNVHFGVLAWLDERSYAGANGRIELYAAPLGSELGAGTEVVIPHARFIEGTAQLHGIRAGTNVVLTWIDERNGNGIADPKPEVWLETLWF